jgi:flavin-dependent dehydrogenase
MDKIVIVGGGSSGWMTAASLVNAFPEKEIIVIESPDFPTIGVGESTVQYIRPWMYSLGIKDEDWMPYADATYKVSIRFENWDGKGGHFHYPFGYPIADDPEAMDLYNWARVGQDVPYNEWAEIFFPAALMAERNVLVKEMEGWDLYENSAYHFDAIKFGQWLKHYYCFPRGVKLIQETVSEIDIADDGSIARLHCDGYHRGEERAIEADLFIDCTGFKGMLIDSVGVPWKDYSYGLPNNKAWAVQIPETFPDQYYTNCTTLGHGWVWHTPTTGRTGTGYVYSDKYISDEDALQEFKDYLNRDDVEDLKFRNISFRVGRREKFAHKNVVAVGLSAGFLEPLESNGLYTVHETLNELTKVLQRNHFRGGDKDSFNHAMAIKFDHFADFIQMHYKYAMRDDTKYWQEVPELTLNEANSLNEFYMDMHHGKTTKLYNAHFNSVAFGLGVNTKSQHDQKFEELFTGEDMVKKGIEYRKHLLERQKGWIEFMENSK